MSFAPGANIGPYEMVGSLGAGGMGEVYRARDTRLGREVALKILPDRFALDSHRRARFLREAHVLASLNHPNICTLHGIEESDGRQVLVLELVEGETLGDRRARQGSGLPLREALPIARQIADALEAGHDHGIVHRDLKPDNIGLRTDGTVKLLDFGVAKALDAADGNGDGRSATITEPAIAPMRALPGTAAYMSPEQARGEPVGASTDVWAFGCLLYEMLTGRPAFARATRSETLAWVLEGEPDFSLLPENTPPLLRRLVHRCLEKDRKIRLRHIADARADLNDATAILSSERAQPSRAVQWVVVSSLAGAAVAAVVMWLALRSTPPRVTRTTIMTAAHAAPSEVGVDTGLRITRDGARLVYIGNDRKQVFVRPLDTLDPVPLVTATGYVQGVFTSPDGHWVGYVDTAYTPKKFPITGGPSVTLLTLDGPSRGATWAPDNTIVFATGALDTGLQQVSADGGLVTVLTRPNRERAEANHIWPQILPDGRGVLFTITAASGGLDAAQVAVLDLASGTSKTLVRGGQDARYVPSGHLVYRAGGTLRAVAFALKARETRGTPVTVVFRVADLDVASDGTLVYIEPTNAAQQRTLVWVDRRGRETPLPAHPGAYYHPRISPVDNTRLAFGMDEDLWVWDLSRAPARLTFTPGIDQLPLWMPGGERLVYGSWRGGGLSNAYIQAADGTGPAEPLSESRHHQLPSGIRPTARQCCSPSPRREVAAFGYCGSRCGARNPCSRPPSTNAMAWFRPT